MNVVLHHSFIFPLIRPVSFIISSSPFSPILTYLSSSALPRPSIDLLTCSGCTFSQALFSSSSPAFLRPSICSRAYSKSTSVDLPFTPSPEDPNKKDHSVKQQDFILIPDPPTNCCMSGCANCVWITYAQELATIYRDGGQAAEQVMKAIEDPSLKIFLSFELKEALREDDDH